METRYRTTKLRRQYEEYRLAERSFGPEVARRYIERINIIKNAQNISDLQAMHVLRCHELKGQRRGHWSVRLTGFYRLIFTLHGTELEIVRIEEVSKHYDD